MSIPVDMVIDENEKTQPEKVIIPSGKDAKELQATATLQGQTPFYSAFAQNNVSAVKNLLAQFGSKQLFQFEYSNAINATMGKRDWIFSKSWMQRFDKYTKEMYDYLEIEFRKVGINLHSWSRFRPLEVFVAKKEAGWNELMIAIMEGDDKRVNKLILQSPKQILERDKQNNNALMHAIAESRVLLAYQLMAVGSLENQLLQRDNVLGHNALSLAVVTLNHSLPFIDHLLNSVNPQVKKQLMMNQGYKRKTALMLACEMPNQEVVKRLTLDVDREILLAKDEGGCFALFHAIWNAKVEAVKALLQWFPQDQLLPIHEDMGLPVWQYVENLAQMQKISLTNDPYELEINIDGPRRDAYLKIASIIRKLYQDLGLNKFQNSPDSNTLSLEPKKSKRSSGNSSVKIEETTPVAKVPKIFNVEAPLSAVVLETTPVKPSPRKIRKSSREDNDSELNGKSSHHPHFTRKRVSGRFASEKTTATVLFPDLTEAPKQEPESPPYHQGALAPSLPAHAVHQMPSTPQAPLQNGHYPYFDPRYQNGHSIHGVFPGAVQIQVPEAPDQSVERKQNNEEEFQPKMPLIFNKISANGQGRGGVRKKSSEDREKSSELLSDTGPQQLQQSQVAAQPYSGHKRSREDDSTLTDQVNNGAGVSGALQSGESATKKQRQ